MKTKRVCMAYFKGIDGMGTCDDGCQWWTRDCPVSQEVNENGT